MKIVNVDDGKTFEVKSARRPSFPWMRTLVKSEVEIEKETPLEEGKKPPRNVPQNWKELSALKKRVEKIENNWFLRLFL